MPSIPTTATVSTTDTNAQQTTDTNTIVPKLNPNADSISQFLSQATAIESQKNLQKASQTVQSIPEIDQFFNDYREAFKKIEPVQSGLVTKPAEDTRNFWNKLADMTLSAKHSYDEATPIVNDMLLSIPQGAVNAVNQAGKVAYKYNPISFGDGDDVLTFKDFIPHIVTPEEWNNRKFIGIPQFYHPKTLLGNVTENMSKFITGFAGASGFLKGVGLVGGLGVTALRGVTAGAATDFTVWDPNEGRLSDVLVEFDSPVLNNAVTQYLKSDPSDTETEGRLKNVYEGMLIGVPLEFLFGIKALKKARATQDIASKEAIYKETSEAIKEVQAGNVDAPIVKKQIVDQNPAINIDKIGEAIKIGKETAKQDSESFIKSILNTKSFNSAEHVLHTIDQVSDLFTAEQRAYLKDNVLKNSVAEELAKTISRDKEELLRILPQISADANQATVRMLATKMVIQELANNLIETSAKHLKAFGEDKKLWTDAARQDILKLSNIIRDSVYSIKEQIRGAARVTQAGNVKVAASSGKRADVEYIATAIKEFNGDAIAIAKKVSKATVEDAIHAVAKTKWQKSVEVFNTTYINSLLSGTGTHKVNALTNLYESIIRPLEQIGGGIIRADHKSIRLGFAQYQGMIMNARQTWDAVRLAFKQSDSVLDSAMRTVDAQQIIAGKAVKTISGANLEVGGRAGTAIDWIGKFIEFPSRLMVSADELFKQINYNGRLYTNALENTMERGLSISSKEGKANIERIMKEGFDDAGRANIKDNPFNEKALQYARQVTFQNEVKGGAYLDIGGAMQKFFNSIPELRFMAPFIRTPTNLWRHFEARIPGLGVFTKQMKEMWNSGDTRLRSEVIGRQVLGTTAGIYAWSLISEVVETKDGKQLPKVTGSGPTDANIKKVWMNYGWQPYSIARVNDDKSITYVQYNRMDPRFYVVGLLADLKENMNNINEKNKEDAFGAAVLSIMHQTIDKTYTKQLADTLDLISKGTEKTWSSYFGNTFGSAIPYSGFRSMFEKTNYETRTFVDGIISKASLGSVLLEPKRDILTGQPIDKIQAGMVINPDGILSVTGILMGPVLVGKAVDVKEDPVMYELARLKVKLASPNINKTPDVDLTDYKKNGQSAYDYWVEHIGKVKDSSNVNFKDKLDYLFKSDIYKHAQEGGEGTTGGREFLVQKVFENYKQLAYDEMLKKYPEAKKDIDASLTQKAGLMKTMSSNQQNKKSIQ